MDYYSSSIAAFSYMPVAKVIKELMKVNREWLLASYFLVIALTSDETV